MIAKSLYPLRHKRCSRVKTAILACSALCLSWYVGGYAQSGTEFSDSLASGGTGPQMTTVAPGRFNMGCVSGLRCIDNLPVHEVNIEQSFALFVYETTIPVNSMRSLLLP